jgi:diguanylate cyclase (GGDEF)-like protein
LNQVTQQKGKNYFVYFITALALLLLVALAVLFIIEREVVKVKVGETALNERHVISLENTLTSHAFDGVISDLKYLSHAYDTALISEDSLQSIVENWSVFSRNRGIYDQIRYIDANGDEQIRINLVDGKAYAVPKAELQNKADRYYFTDTIKLPAESIYISKLDLNVEREAVEVPFKPMIRFATPIYDYNGNVQGIIVLNYMAQDLLDRFRVYAENSYGEVVLINDDGYWVSSEDEAQNWHFMFEDQLGDSFASRYPEVWQRLLNGQSQFLTSEGLFTVDTMQLSTSMQETDNVVLGDGSWHIVSKVDSSNAYYKVDSWAILNTVVRTNGPLFLMLVFVSAMAGYLMHLNRKTYHEMKYYSEFDTLTQFYNRRAGYQKIDDILQANYRDPIDMSLCFMDINGLKSVNDSLGHQYGDELIATAARLIKANLTTDDFAIRLGGDEFLIVFINKDVEAAEANWQQIVEAFDRVNLTEDRPYVVSLSHGIVKLNSSRMLAIDEHLQRADALMYEEKAILKEQLVIVRKSKRV